MPTNQKTIVLVAILCVLLFIAVCAVAGVWELFGRRYGYLVLIISLIVFLGCVIGGGFLRDYWKKQAGLTAPQQSQPSNAIRENVQPPAAAPVPPTMRTCNSCKAANPPENNFCEQCGKPLSS